MMCLTSFGMVIEIDQFIWQFNYFTILGVALCFVFFNIQLTGKYLLLQFSPAHSASFVDGFRNACSTCFRIIGLSSAALIFQYGGFVIISLAVLVMLLAFAVLKRRQKFLHGLLNH